MVRFLEICFTDTSANMLTIQLVFDTSRHISIGIAAGDMKLSRLSGWERNSWGYHGDFFFFWRRRRRMGGLMGLHSGVSSSAPILF